MTGASKLTIESSLLVNLPFGGVQVIGTGTLKMINTIVRDSDGGTAVSLLNGAIFIGSSMIANNQYAYWKDESCAAIYTAGNNQLNVNTYTYGTLTPLALR